MNVYVDVPLSIALVCLASLIAIVFDKVALDAVVFSTANEPDRTKTPLTVKEADKGEKILQEAMKNSNDPSVKNMASTALDFVEKFVKKQPTLVQGQTQGKQKKKGK